MSDDGRERCEGQTSLVVVSYYRWFVELLEKNQFPKLQKCHSNERAHKTILHVYVERVCVHLVCPSFLIF